MIVINNFTNKIRGISRISADFKNNKKMSDNLMLTFTNLAEKNK